MFSLPDKRIKKSAEYLSSHTIYIWTFLNNAAEISASWQLPFPATRSYSSIWAWSQSSA
jgi:hypothetical protein